MYEPTASPITWEGQVIGNWCLEKRLGEGGMSYVYLGTHQWLPQRGAVKVLRSELCQEEEAVERFRREALASSQLEHPNVVHIHDFGRDDDLGYFMVLELLDGADLEEHMSAAPFPKDWIYALMEQVCSALAATHKADIVHRDLKPSNIFLLPHEPYPTVKLLDFGIAKLPQVDKKLTQTGVLVGTPTSLAPEQLAQQSDLITPLVDIYATGVLLYQLFTGKLPISHSNLAEHLMAIFNEVPPPLGAHRKELAGSALEALVAQMLAKSPQNRPPTMKDVWQELSAALDAFDDPLAGDAVPTIEETSLSMRGLPTGMSITEEPSRVQHPAANRRRKGKRVPLPTVDEGPEPIAAKSRPPLPTGSPLQSPAARLSPPSMPAVQPPSSASLTLYWMLITFFVVGVGGGIGYVVWIDREQPKADVTQRVQPTPARRATPRPTPRLSLSPLESLYAQGTKALKAKHFLKAALLWRRITKQPTWKKSHLHPLLYRGIGAAFAKQGHHYAALAHYKLYLKAGPPKQEQPKLQALIKRMEGQLTRRLAQAKALLKRLALLLKHKQWQAWQTRHTAGVLAQVKAIDAVAPSAPQAQEPLADLFAARFPAYAMARYQQLLDSLDLDLARRRTLRAKLHQTRIQLRRFRTSLDKMLQRAIAQLHKKNPRGSARILAKSLRQHPLRLPSRKAFRKVLKEALPHYLSGALQITRVYERHRRKLETHKQLHWLGHTHKGTPTAHELKVVAKLLRSFQGLRQQLKLVHESVHTRNTKPQAQLKAAWDKHVSDEKKGLAKTQFKGLKLHKMGFPEGNKLDANLAQLTRLKAKQEAVLKLLYLGKHERFQQELRAFARQLKASEAKLAPLLSSKVFGKWHKYLERMRKRAVFLAKLFAQAEAEYKREKWLKAAELYKQYLLKQPHAHNKAVLQEKIKRCKCALGVTWEYCKQFKKRR